jgi:hypothetical protein
MIMSENKTITIGQAIDTIISTLSGLTDDKDRQIVINTVQKHLGLCDSSERAVPAGNSLTPPLPHPVAANSGILDIRTLKEEKAPSTAAQMACIVAYYLKEVAVLPEKKDTVGTADMDKYFKQAGFKLPKKLNQLLIDCKQSGYLDSVSSGTYKLNAVGYNLVAHSLPKGKK